MEVQVGGAVSRAPWIHGKNKLTFICRLSRPKSEPSSLRFYRESSRCYT